MNRLFAAWILAVAVFFSCLLMTVPLSLSPAVSKWLATAIIVAAILCGGSLIATPYAFSECVKKSLAVVALVVAILVFGVLTMLPQVLQNDRAHLITAGIIAVGVFVLSIWIVISELFSHGLSRLMAAWGVAVGVFIFVFGAIGIIFMPPEAWTFHALLRLSNDKTTTPAQLLAVANQVAKSTQDPDLKAFADHFAQKARCWDVLVGDATKMDVVAGARRISSNELLHPQELAQWEALSSDRDGFVNTWAACMNKYSNQRLGWKEALCATVGAFLAFWLVRILKIPES